MRTVKFYTLGCKVNQYDTQSIRERFLRCGFRELYNGKQADIYVVNTCTVTASAQQQSRQIIRNCSKVNPDAKILVTGCLVEQDAPCLTDLEAIDFIISKRFFPEGISKFLGHTRAFLKIQDGCNNFCSYCKVPLVRGRSVSRHLSGIVSEAKRLINNGFKEIVLSGICLGAYGRDLSPKIDLIDVLEEISKIEGLLRLRLSSIEAGDVSRGLIDKIANSKKICRHLHIPIQSGDDEILKKMNRTYSAADYLNLIKKIKKYIPQTAITTDVLVGFPGESEINFKNTLDLVKKILPLKVHIFPYSRREGTFAAGNFKNELEPVIMKERILDLKKVADTCALIYKRQFLNKEVDVLIEGHCKENPGYWQGHTDNYIKVLVKSSENLNNRFISVKLKGMTKDSLSADIINKVDK